MGWCAVLRRARWKFGRKNSTTVIIPNVAVTTRTVTNWNHARGFIAFDDILVTVPYKVDPAHVRELLCGY